MHMEITLLVIYLYPSLSTKCSLKKKFKKYLKPNLPSKQMLISLTCPLHTEVILRISNKQTCLNI